MHDRVRLDPAQIKNSTEAASGSFKGNKQADGDDVLSPFATAMAPDPLDLGVNGRFSILFGSAR
jgi:hypothetical protein